jgi:hypothetical protein
MDLSRAVYSRDLKITTMRALDAALAPAKIARKCHLSRNWWSAGAQNGA